MEVQAAFQLPAALTVASFHGGIAGAWRVRLQTGGGGYSVKVHIADAPDYQLEKIRTAGALEQRCLAAGIDVVPPLAPVSPDIGLAARIGDHLVWVHRWVDHASESDAEADESVHRWLGTTAAKLHAEWPGPNDREAELDQSYGIHPLAEWRRWFEEADRQGQPWTNAARDILPVIVEAMALALPDLPRCITHRDLNPPNILHGPDGPRLCDFGSTGVDVAWFEIVNAAVSFGQPGPVTLESYLAAGGAPGPLSTEALARRCGETVSFLAFSMWLSLGHRPVTQATRDLATARVPALVDKLTTQVETLDPTRRMLFGR